METYTFDASKEPLGRIVTKTAVLLLGKHRPSFERHRKLPLAIIVTNADRLVLTGRKWHQKQYHRHSGYIGNLKTTSAESLRSRDPREIFRHALRGMLPKNRLRAQLIKRVTIYRGDAPRSRVM